MSFTIANLARCQPFKAQWIPDLPGARCINNTARFFAGQGFHIFLDFAILLIPLFILRHLRVPLPQKLLVGVVLGFGGM
jgi:hypothetical protein